MSMFSIILEKPNRPVPKTQETIQQIDKHDLKDHCNELDTANIFSVFFTQIIQYFIWSSSFANASSSAGVKSRDF